MPWEATGGRWQDLGFREHLGSVGREGEVGEGGRDTYYIQPLFPKVPTWGDGPYDAPTKREDIVVKTRSAMRVRSLFHFIGGLFGPSKTTVLHHSRGAMHPASHVTGSYEAQKHEVLTF